MATRVRYLPLLLVGFLCQAADAPPPRPIEPVPLVSEVQAAALAAFQAAAALKADYVKLHDRLTKQVAPGSPAAGDLVAALQALLARAASSHIGYPEVTIGIKADLTTLKVAVPTGKPNEDFWVDNHDDQIGKPLTYVDDKTGITFYVEADARHVVAISSTGSVLWRRDPFVDAHLEPYRVARPVIRVIGRRNSPPGGIEIAFDSSQFGSLDLTTGNFDFYGQD